MYECDPKRCGSCTLHQVCATQSRAEKRRTVSSRFPFVMPQTDADSVAAPRVSSQKPCQQLTQQKTVPSSASTKNSASESTPTPLSTTIRFPSANMAQQTPKPPQQAATNPSATNGASHPVSYQPAPRSQEKQAQSSTPKTPSPQRCEIATSPQSSTGLPQPHPSTCRK